MLRIVALTVVFIFFIYAVGRPQAVRSENWYRRAGKLTPDALAVVVFGALASAWITVEIGVHPIFGAFMFGMILAHNDGFVRELLGRLEQLSALLPLFLRGYGIRRRYWPAVGVGLVGRPSRT